MDSKRKEATNTMMVDLLAKFAVDACKTSLEFISCACTLIQNLVYASKNSKPKKCLPKLDQNRILQLKRPREKKPLDITDMSTFRFFFKIQPFGCQFSVHAWH